MNLETVDLQKINGNVFMLKIDPPIQVYGFFFKWRELNIAVETFKNE